MKELPHRQSLSCKWCLCRAGAAENSSRQPVTKELESPSRNAKPDRHPWERNFPRLSLPQASETKSKYLFLCFTKRRLKTNQLLPAEVKRERDSSGGWTFHFVFFLLSIQGQLAVSSRYSKDVSFVPSASTYCYPTWVHNLHPKKPSLAVHPRSQKSPIISQRQKKRCIH